MSFQDPYVKHLWLSEGDTEQSQHLHFIGENAALSFMFA
jgi:hypothetical protein